MTERLTMIRRWQLEDLAETQEPQPGAPVPLVQRWKLDTVGDAVFSGKLPNNTPADFGGPGSGNKGHAGIIGHRGGSRPTGRASLIPAGFTDEEAIRAASVVFQGSHTEDDLHAFNRFMDAVGRWPDEYPTQGDFARAVIKEAAIRMTIRDSAGILNDKAEPVLNELFDEGGIFYPYRVVMEDNPLTDLPEVNKEWGIDSPYQIRPANMAAVGWWDAPKNGAEYWTIHVYKDSDKYGLSNAEVYWHELSHTIPNNVVEKYAGKQTGLSGDWHDAFAKNIIKRLAQSEFAMQDFGGPGSGHFKHEGIPGHKGGSAPDDTATQEPTADPYTIMRNYRAFTTEGGKEWATDNLPLEAYGMENTAVLNYVSDGSKYMNNALRTDTVEKLKVSKQNDIKRLDALISRQEIPGNVVVYRGFGDSFLRDNLQPGKTWKDNGFVSTSFDKATAGTFDHTAALLVPKGVHGFYWGGDEAELILERGLKYQTIGEINVGDWVKIPLIQVSRD